MNGTEGAEGLEVEGEAEVTEAEEGETLGQEGDRHQRAKHPQSSMHHTQGTILDSLD